MTLGNKMSAFRKITARDKPAVLAQSADRYTAHLRLALELATSRARRSSREIRSLYGSATIEGLASRLDVKAGVVSFTAAPFKGGLHQIYPWQVLEDMSVSELAAGISWSLRESLKQRLRDA